MGIAMGIGMNSHCGFSQYHTRICSVLRELAKHSYFTFTMVRRPPEHFISPSRTRHSKVSCLTMWIWRSLRTLMSDSSTTVCCQSCSYVDCCASTSASSAASGRVFMDAFLTYLSPSSVDSLLFLHSNMQWEMNYISQPSDLDISE